jgi:hypothetical protein
METIFFAKVGFHKWLVSVCERVGNFIIKYKLIVRMNEHHQLSLYTAICSHIQNFKSYKSKFKLLNSRILIPISLKNKLLSESKNWASNDKLKFKNFPIPLQTFAGTILKLKRVHHQFWLTEILSGLFWNFLGWIIYIKMEKKIYFFLIIFFPTKFLK